ncbi:hypothetical protein [Streptomyces sp. DSM 15324]|nr:hypothetical protein [Streptomyces sp. DSM 15324]
MQPYLAPRPEGLSPEDGQRWFFGTPAVPLPARRVEELLAAATR